MRDAYGNEKKDGSTTTESTVHSRWLHKIPKVITVKAVIPGKATMEGQRAI